MASALAPSAASSMPAPVKRKSKKKQAPIPDEEFVIPSVITVMDPASKARLQIEFDKTENTNGRETLIQNLQRKCRRDAYLCMLYQKEQCRSYARCNQIHADRKIVAEFRERQGKLNGVEPLSNQREKEFVAAHPDKPGVKVIIPFTKTEETEGRRRAMNGKEDCAICLPYLDNKCSLNGACEKIHVDKKFVKHLRDESRPCCPYHDRKQHVDCTQDVYIANRHSLKFLVPKNRLSNSKGFEELVQQSASRSIVFNYNRVCRLHQEKRCQWVDRCANLHLCREFYSFHAYCQNPSASLPTAEQEPPLHQNGQGVGNGPPPSCFPHNPYPPLPASHPDVSDLGFAFPGARLPEGGSFPAFPTPSVGLEDFACEPRMVYGVPLVVEGRDGRRIAVEYESLPEFAQEVYKNMRGGHDQPNLHTGQVPGVSSIVPPHPFTTHSTPKCSNIAEATRVESDDEENEEAPPPVPQDKILPAGVTSGFPSCSSMEMHPSLHKQYSTNPPPLWEQEVGEQGSITSFPSRQEMPQLISQPSISTQPTYY